MAKWATPWPLPTQNTQPPGPLLPQAPTATQACRPGLEIEGMTRRNRSKSTCSCPRLTTWSRGRPGAGQTGWRGGRSLGGPWLSLGLWEGGRASGPSVWIHLSILISVPPQQRCSSPGGPCKDRRVLWSCPRAGRCPFPHLPVGDVAPPSEPHAPTHLGRFRNGLLPCLE